MISILANGGRKIMVGIGLFACLVWAAERSHRLAHREYEFNGVIDGKQIICKSQHVGFLDTGVMLNVSTTNGSSVYYSAQISNSPEEELRVKLESLGMYYGEQDAARFGVKGFHFSRRKLYDVENARVLEMGQDNVEYYLREIKRMKIEPLERMRRE